MDCPPTLVALARGLQSGGGSQIRGDMNRRFFLRLLGIAPFVPLAAKLPVVASPKPAWSGIDNFMGFAFVRTNLGPTPKEKFDASLEDQGLLSFSERIDVMPHRCNTVQVLHTADAEPLQRYTWVDADEDLSATLPKLRENTRSALRKYWAQQIRWRRKVDKAKARA